MWGVRLLGDVSVSVWEAIFMLVVLKIPLVYLGIVVWWAIHAEPEPAHGGDEVGVLAPLTPCGWNESRSEAIVAASDGPDSTIGALATTCAGTSCVVV